MKAYRYAGLVIAILFFAVPQVFAQEPRVWVTLDAADAVSVRDNLSAEGIPIQVLPFGPFDAVATARLNEQDLIHLTRLMHDNHQRCGGFRVHKSKQEALAVNARIDSVALAQASSHSLVDYALTNADVAETLQAAVEEEHIRDVIIHLSSYPNRFYTSSSGIEAAEWIRDYWDSLTKDRGDASSELISHSGFPQPSAVLTIQGSVFPDEIVVLGAHLDSTASGSIAPGADDDASGIATLSEVIRVIVETGFRPQRTIKFMGYAGEEGGLRGSGQIADSYELAGTDVIGAYQLDMTNYHGSVEVIWILTDYTNAAQNSFVANLIDTYLTDLTRSTTACGYACSDHASWHLAGYVVSMTAETRFGQHNPFIHTSNDTISVSNNKAVHAVKFARLAACFVAELGKGSLGEVPNNMKQSPVSVRTLADLMTGYGACESAECPRDINADGKIDAVDLAVLIERWPSVTCLGFTQGKPCTE